MNILEEDIEVLKFLNLAHIFAYNSKSVLQQRASLVRTHFNLRLFGLFAFQAIFLVTCLKIFMPSSLILFVFVFAEVSTLKEKADNYEKDLQKANKVSKKNKECWCAQIYLKNKIIKTSTRDCHYWIPVLASSLVNFCHY